MLSSTVYSQITGIDRKQKQEIVSTLEAYPIVLQELNETQKLLSLSNEKVSKLTTINNNLELALKYEVQKGEIKDKQIDLVEKQLDSIKTSIGDKITYGVFGFSVGVITTLIIILL